MVMVKLKSSCALSHLSLEQPCEIATILTPFCRWGWETINKLPWSHSWNVHSHNFIVNLTLVCLLSELILTVLHIASPNICEHVTFGIDTYFYPRLSWGLMYAGFIFIMSIFMALVITSIQIIVMTGFMVIFTLFILYGLSLVSWHTI